MELGLETKLIKAHWSIWGLHLLWVQVFSLDTLGYEFVWSDLTLLSAWHIPTDPTIHLLNSLNELTNRGATHARRIQRVMIGAERDFEIKRKTGMLLQQRQQIHIVKLCNFTLIYYTNSMTRSRYFGWSCTTIRWHGTGQKYVFYLILYIFYPFVFGFSYGRKRTNTNPLLGYYCWKDGMPQKASTVSFWIIVCSLQIFPQPYSCDSIFWIRCLHRANQKSVPWLPFHSFRDQKALLRSGRPPSTWNYRDDEEAV